MPFDIRKSSVQSFKCLINVIFSEVRTTVLVVNGFDISRQRLVPVHHDRYSNKVLRISKCHLSKEFIEEGLFGC